jgi:lysozyme
MSKRVPSGVASRVVAVLALAGGVGVSGVAVHSSQVASAQRDAYVQAVAFDADTSTAVKIAMVMGSYYESSGRHIGTPYVDKLGKGQPLTVCNGITGKGVIAGKLYSPADCYALEKGRYIKSEAEASGMLRYWVRYDPLAQATFIDFVHNKGGAALSGSTMRAKANAGDLQGACMQNERWNRGTVKGVSTVLTGLKIRGDANADICSIWRVTPAGGGK